MKNNKHMSSHHHSANKMMHIINSMEKSPWDADIHSAGQNILHILWNPKDRYRVTRTKFRVFPINMIALLYGIYHIHYLKKRTIWKHTTSLYA